MKRWLPINVLSIALTALAFGGIAQAGQIWTDGNGDGLPDGDGIVAVPSTNVTVGVWIDAQSFSWTNFLAYVEWSGDCISYVSASYVISGGSNFPIDNFSHPRGIGFGGSGYTQGGIDHIGNVTLHINTPLSCCVSPIIDIYNPYYVFSQLGAGSAYMLFSTNPGTCYPGEGGGSGACCFPDFSCIPNLTLDECQAAGGTQWLEGQDCTACPDRPPLEGCCFADGSCVDFPIGTCPPGSVPQGLDCASITCPPPVTGACCLLGGAGCLEGATLAECDAVGGLWFPGVPCEDACEPDAVEPKSWGKIKGLYR